MVRNSGSGGSRTAGGDAASIVGSGTISAEDVTRRPVGDLWMDDLDDPGPKPADLYGKFTWKIENFFEISKRELRSNVFEVGGYKWYILVYPQGCDVCNHLSLFLCVADYDKLLPGWSHFAQFTIAVVNKDPKKSKYSDTLHRFCKKEHDWGWKKFMEISKVLEGFAVADTLVIKAQVQVIRESSVSPFRCLDGQYRRELVRVYLTNVEGICRRFYEERREKLERLRNAEGAGLRSFWESLPEKQRRHLTTNKRDGILKAVAKRFFNEKEVTSTLVMDALCCGHRALRLGFAGAGKDITDPLGIGSELAVSVDDNGNFGIVGDALSVLDRYATDQIVPPDTEFMGGKNTKANDVTSGEKGEGPGGSDSVGGSGAENNCAEHSSSNDGCEGGGGKDGDHDNTTPSMASKDGEGYIENKAHSVSDVLGLPVVNTAHANETANISIEESNSGDGADGKPKGKVPDGKNKDGVDRDERRLAELGRRVVEMFYLGHVYLDRIETAYREAVALKRQEALIAEEEEEERVSAAAAEKRNKKKEKKARQKAEAQAKADEERAVREEAEAAEARRRAAEAARKRELAERKEAEKKARLEAERKARFEAEAEKLAARAAEKKAADEKASALAARLVLERELAEARQRELDERARSLAEDGKRERERSMDPGTDLISDPGAIFDENRTFDRKSNSPRRESIQNEVIPTKESVSPNRGGTPFVPTTVPQGLENTGSNDSDGLAVKLAYELTVNENKALKDRVRQLEDHLREKSANLAAVERRLAKIQKEHQALQQSLSQGFGHLGTQNRQEGKEPILATPGSSTSTQLQGNVAFERGVANAIVGVSASRGPLSAVAQNSSVPVVNPAVMSSAAAMGHGGVSYRTITGVAGPVLFHGGHIGPPSIASSIGGTRGGPSGVSDLERLSSGVSGQSFGGSGTIPFANASGTSGDIPPKGVAGNASSDSDSRMSHGMHPVSHMSDDFAHLGLINDLLDGPDLLGNDLMGALDNESVFGGGLMGARGLSGNSMFWSMGPHNTAHTAVNTQRSDLAPGISASSAPFSLGVGLYERQGISANIGSHAQDK